MIDKIKKHRKIWKEKKILQIIYKDWFTKMIDELTPGKTLELGSGIGSFKEFKKDLISSDYQKYPWLDMSFDAHKIPFKKASLNNIVMLDVLHHLENPVLFFHEAFRVLKKGGRIVMIEPYPSPVSLKIYQLFHPEPFIFSTDYFKIKKSNKADKDPWDANQAIPYLLFFKNKHRFQKLFKKEFKILKIEKMSLFLYPLSGGFENKSKIADSLIPFIMRLEKIFYPLTNLMAFRCFIVLEKE